MFERYVCTACERQKVRIGDEIEFYPDLRQLFVKGQHIQLSRQESIVFDLLVCAQGTLVSKEVLITALYPHNAQRPATADIMHASVIHQLREKLPQVSIRCLRKQGYSLHLQSMLCRRLFSEAAD